MQFPGMYQAVQGDGQSVISRIEFGKFEISKAIRIGIGRNRYTGSIARNEIRFAERHSGVGCGRSVFEKCARQDTVGRFAARPTGMVGSFAATDDAENQEKEGYR